MNQRPDEDEHQHDVADGQPRHESRPANRGLGHADDQGQQAPRGRIINSRAGDGDDTEARLGHLSVGQDARQDRERSD